MKTTRNNYTNTYTLKEQKHVFFNRLNINDKTHKQFHIQRCRKLVKKILFNSNKNLEYLKKIEQSSPIHKTEHAEKQNWLTSDTRKT